MAPRALSRRGFLAALAAAQPPLFEELPAARSGIRWIHQNALTPKRFLPESLGPGVAFIDFDNSGWPSIFLVNGGPADFSSSASGARHALYRNNRNGTFTDIAAKSGVAGGAFYGMGVAVGDYNNDGFEDMLVTGYGGAALYRNNGNGTFTDVTAKSGLHLPKWTTSAVWADFHGDGLLDLFVCGFVQYDPAAQDLCIKERGGKPGYCIPRMFRPGACQFYKNNGDGTFKDVSRESGVAARASKALGVVATDVNNDGRMDLFVANDTVENFLFVNKGGGRFEDQAFGALVALSESGWARSGMGVDAADIDGDGHQDLIVANIDRERYSIYRNSGHGMFDDLSFAGEIGRVTYNMSGWGLRFADFDNDGVLELILANGHPDDLVQERRPQVTYTEPLLYLTQKGNGQFRDASAAAGPAFGKRYSARGLATGDFDNNGLLDVLIGVNGGAPVLLENRHPRNKNNWIGVTLVGKKANRDGTGARIRWRAAGVSRERFKRAGGSYLSSSDRREILGLGQADRLDWIEVHWPAPSNRVERFTGLATGAYIRIEEGSGSPVSR